MGQNQGLISKRIKSVRFHLHRIQIMFLCACSNNCKCFICWNSLSPDTETHIYNIKGEEETKDNYIVRTNYGSGPRPHVDVISIIHSIADRSISNTFFSTFKFLQQSEVPRNCTETQTFKSQNNCKVDISILGLPEHDLDIQRPTNSTSDNWCFKYRFQSIELFHGFPNDNENAS